MADLEDEIKLLQQTLADAEHELAMRDPTYRAMYEKYGDPIQLGRTHARLIIRQRDQQEQTK